MRLKSVGLLAIPEDVKGKWENGKHTLRKKSRRYKIGGPPRPASLRTYWNSYVAAVNILIRNGEYDPSESEAARWTTQRIEVLRQATKPSGKPYAPNALRSWLSGIAEVVSVLEPGCERSHIRASIKSVPRDPTRAKYFEPPDVMLGFGVAIMQKALDELRAGRDWTSISNEQKWNAVSNAELWRVHRVCVRFRTGLQIAWLARLALRLSNLTMIEVGKGRHLRFMDQWWLVFAEHEMKGDTVYDRMLHDDLAPWLESYWREVRPILCHGSSYGGCRTLYTGAALWVTGRGTPQSQQSIRKKVQELTKKTFKRAISPHWFRDALATDMAMRDPAHASQASWALTNAPDTTNDTYNHAGCCPARLEVARRRAAIRERWRRRKNGEDDATPA